jgi:hypothetical protein
MAKQKQKLFEIDGRNRIWSIPSWCQQFGCSEPSYYALDPKPHQVKINRLVRITESPADYAERMRQAQKVAA